MTAAATMPAAVPAAGMAEELWCRFAATGDVVGAGLVAALSTVDGRPALVVVADAVADRCRLGAADGEADTPACEESDGGALDLVDAWLAGPAALELLGG